MHEDHHRRTASAVGGPHVEPVLVVARAVDVDDVAGHQTGAALAPEVRPRQAGRQRGHDRTERGDDGEDEDGAAGGARHG